MASRLLVELLDRIELERLWNWPLPTRVASSVAIPKPTTDVFDVLTWRHLTILSAHYRNRANARFWGVAPWVGTWFPDEVFAGFWGRGAEDAWNSTAATVEAELLAERMLSGAVDDIYECFEMLPRIWESSAPGQDFRSVSLTHTSRWRSSASCYINISRIWATSARFGRCLREILGT